MIIPIGHDHPPPRIPVVTFALILLNIAVFIAMLSAADTNDGQLIRARNNYETFRAQLLAKYSPQLRSANQEDEPLDRDIGRLTERQKMDLWDELMEQFAKGEAGLELAADVAPMAGANPQETEVERLNRLWAEYEQARRGHYLFDYALIPAERRLLTFITSMFLHGSLSHLLGNLLFLYLAGVAVEGTLGPALYLLFYVAGGFLSGVVHIIFNPTSSVPTIGASGAIAAVLGAFLVFHYRANLKFFYFFFLFFRLKAGTFTARASIMIPLWFLIQFFYALMYIDRNSGIAFWAHIGGFITGLGIALGLRRWRPELAPAKRVPVSPTELIAAIQGAQPAIGPLGARLTSAAGEQPPLAGPAPHAPLFYPAAPPDPIRPPWSIDSDHPAPLTSDLEDQLSEIRGACLRGQALHPRTLRAIVSYARRPASRDAAIGGLEQIAGQFPDADFGPDVRALLAQAAAGRGDVERAMELLQAIVSSAVADEHRSQALFKLAQLLDLRLNRRQEALAVYKRIDHEFPATAWAAAARTELRRAG